MQGKVCGKKRHTKTEIRSEISELICGRIAAGENYNLTRDNWGDLDEEDKQTNEDALQYPDDLYLLATHKTCKGKIYIITERISENAGDKCNYSMFS